MYRSQAKTPSVQPFVYQRAVNVTEAVRQIGAGGAYLAGGTNLIDHLRLGISTYKQLVDISRLPLNHIMQTEDGLLQIGAMVRNSDMACHPLIRKHVPLVAQALLSGASGQLRNMATTGGNLLQRTRCVYFQDLTTPCNKRLPGSGCSARDGFGRYNALFGTSEHCVAVHPSDLCVALAALDTVVVVQGLQTERRILFSDLHRLPGDTPYQDNNLVPGELITGIEIAPLAFAATSRYRKVRDRSSYAFALVSVAAALDVREGLVHDVRLAFGGASHKPHRARHAEAALRGQPANSKSYLAAAKAELSQASTGAHNEYKVPMLRNTMVAVLNELSP
jgi:xanthine dehydrogenase YagS FAD-binding subunit